MYRWHGVREDNNKPFDPLKGPLAAYLGSGRVGECPGRPELRRGSVWDESFEKGSGGYGYNMSYIGSRLWDVNASYPYRKSTKITEVKHPVDTLMFADCAFDQNGSLIEYSFAEPRYWIFEGIVFKDPPFPVPSIHFRHRKKANIGWTDGHIDSKVIFESSDDSIYDGGKTGYKIGWFEPMDNSLLDLK
jgi:prepilin-type processing-associated H-X9-DG protein